MQRKAVPTLGAVLLLAGVASGPLLAQDSSQEELARDKNRMINAGVMGGAAVGAALGGPPGAVLTSAIGAWIGDKLAITREHRHLTASLATAEAELQDLREDNTELQMALSRSERALDTGNLVASSATTSPALPACCTSSALVLHFRSNSDQVESLYDDALREFAASLRGVPNAVVELSGHADRRGENSPNLALSQRRVQAVEQRLREFGLRDAVFHTTASGEQRPLSKQDSVETNFFDRRVDVRLVSAGTTRVSMN